MLDEPLPTLATRLERIGARRRMIPEHRQASRDSLAADFGSRRPRLVDTMESRPAIAGVGYFEDINRPKVVFKLQNMQWLENRKRTALSQTFYE